MKGRGTNIREAVRRRVNKQHEAFIDAYVNDVKRNQTRAAIAAGYSERTARQQACRLMKREDIKAEIKARKKEIRKQNTAKAAEVIMFLTRVMRGEERIDNVALRCGDGSEEMELTNPNAKDRLKAAELLGKYYGIFDAGADTEDSGGIVMIAEAENEEGS